MKKLLVYLSMLALLSAISVITACSNAGGADISENPPRIDPIETFDDDEKPETYSLNSISITGPWGYSRSENATRRYPLLVVGCWGEGAGEYAKVAELYPAFVIEYQKDGVSDGQALSDWIDEAVTAGYRIDTDRIYLTGFSQGGSGSFPLAKGMYAKGKYFAAIVRVAGQSQSDLTNAIAEKTAVWYHLGLDDSETRINVARDTLKNFRAFACNAGARESSLTDVITGHDRTTITLTRSGFPMFKYSEYTGMGHSSSACYRDEALFAWMFARRIGK